jgi:2-oxoglutarate/2-oxoacid ferredoxin oxidoreductase subunit beta
MSQVHDLPMLTPKDFAVEQPVKWCAGCGNYAILNSVKNALPQIGALKEDVVFVSGIGCSSRFPYYVKTYGFHGLHGRASAIASGVKLANPKLSVWVITGDGDSMAIGGNHFIHLLRRNIDINILLLNNKIYGLTKGQYSPTTPFGSVTKTSPEGTIEHPFKPGELAMGSGATFFARVLDTEPRIMTEIFVEAAKHKGTSLVEIMENCVIFNNQVHAEITGKDVKDDHTIYLRHGEKMIFGKEGNRGLILDGLKLKAVTIGENGITMDHILTHDAKGDDTMHYILARMTLPELPVAIGIIRQFESIRYSDLMVEQIETARAKSSIKSVDDLLQSGNVFVKE